MSTSPAAQIARRCELRLAKFYRAKALTALGSARQARWIGREGSVADLLAEALKWRQFSNLRAQRARQAGQS